MFKNTIPLQIRWTPPSCELPRTHLKTWPKTAFRMLMIIWTAQQNLIHSLGFACVISNGETDSRCPQLIGIKAKSGLSSLAFHIWRTNEGGRAGTVGSERRSKRPQVTLARR